MESFRVASFGGERTAKEKEKVNQLAIREQKVIEDIRSQLESLGHKTDEDIEQIDGFRTGFEIKWTKSSDWYYSGSLRMVMYDEKNTWNKKSYPEPKKGFDIEKAVSRLLALIEQIKEEEKHQKAYDKIKEKRRLFLNKCLEEEGFSPLKSWACSSVELQGIEIETASVDTVRLKLNGVSADQLHQILDIMTR